MTYTEDRRKIESLEAELGEHETKVERGLEIIRKVADYGHAGEVGSLREWGAVNPNHSPGKPWWLCNHPACHEAAQYLESLGALH